MVAFDDSIDKDNKNKMLVNRHSKKFNIDDINNLDNPFFLNSLCKEKCCRPPPLKKNNNNKNNKKNDDNKKK